MRNLIDVHYNNLVKTLVMRTLITDQVRNWYFGIIQEVFIKGKMSSPWCRHRI